MTVAEKLVELYRARKMTCATAESCTGGGVSAAITDVPGSSVVFMGGVVSYANDVKERLLGVHTEMLEKVGAVSSETAAQMAMGVRTLLKTDVAVSVTGIAGPDGGSDTKPVGLVWFGLATTDGVRTEKCLFHGDRASIREQAVTHALGMLTVTAL